MELLSLFELPIRSWPMGMYNEEYEINDSFFNQFESGLVTNGTFKVNCEIEKLIDSLIVKIDYLGFSKTQCDRCLAEIDLPMNGSNSYLINYSDAPRDEGEVIYINRDKASWNVAPLIWDSINLGFPYVRIYDCRIKEPFPCDIDVLSKLEMNENITSSGQSDAMWSILSDLRWEEE